MLVLLKGKSYSEIESLCFEVMTEAKKVSILS